MVTIIILTIDYPLINHGNINQLLVGTGESTALRWPSLIGPSTTKNSASWDGGPWKFRGGHPSKSHGKSPFPWLNLRIYPLVNVYKKLSKKWPSRNSGWLPINSMVIIFPVLYVVTNIASENGHRNSWFSHGKWWIFPVRYVFTRGYGLSKWQPRDAKIHASRDRLRWICCDVWNPAVFQETTGWFLNIAMDCMAHRLIYRWFMMIELFTGWLS